MSSYSLTLREEKGFKLTTQELDNNFRYVLENASGSGTQGPQGPTGPSGSGTQGPQGPTGPSGGGGSGSIEIISMTISALDLLNSYGTPYEVIPSPGTGKMIEVLWGRYKLYPNGVQGPQDWGSKGDRYFSIYPAGPQGPQGFKIGFMNNNQYIYNKYLPLGSQGSVNNADTHEYIEGAQWFLKVNDFYTNDTIINLVSVTGTFQVNDLVTFLSGATASVTVAGLVDKGEQEIYVDSEIPNGVVSQLLSAAPSGAQGTIDSFISPNPPGDYDMELYLAYQTFDLL